VAGNSRLGLADPPYSTWNRTDLTARFNGPALARLPDGRLPAGSRSKSGGSGAPKTVLGWLATGPPALYPFLELPSEHETGYPGLIHHAGHVWASYYSSQAGKTAICVAELERSTRAK
jgi:hypothetical protein